MKIVLSEKNRVNEETILLALGRLSINPTLVYVDVIENEIASTNDELLYNVQNNNQQLLCYCKDNNIKFDAVLSFKDGYEKVDNHYFMVTYASLIDSKNREYFGKSTGMEVTKNMYRWVKKGKSINKVLKEITKEGKTKEQDCLKYLTDEVKNKQLCWSNAIINASLEMKNYDKYYEKLDNVLSKKLEK